MPCLQCPAAWFFVYLHILCEQARKALLTDATARVCHFKHKPLITARLSAVYTFCNNTAYSCYMLMLLLLLPQPNVACKLIEEYDNDRMSLSYNSVIQLCSHCRCGAARCSAL